MKFLTFYKTTHNTSRDISHPKKARRGFTLVELLVVISVISLMSSIILNVVNAARDKADDAKRKQEIKAFSLAIGLYYDKYGQYPTNPYGGGPYCSGDSGTANNFDAVAQTLVTEGYIGRVPQSPTGSNRTYCYYRYAKTTPASTEAGAMVLTALETGDARTTPYPGTCRPFTPGEAPWCNNNSTRDYCLCHPY